MKIFVVADPNNNRNGMLINGVPSRFLFQFAIDYDYESLYPITDITFNIDGPTQIGLIKFEDDLGINPVTKQPVNSSDFVGHLVSKNYIRLGHDYFNLPLASNIAIELLEEEGFDLADIS